MKIGRFAPSPTGALHMGSLVAAMASYLDVANDGQWLLRIDDIDPPRTTTGSADRIIRQLKAFGFQWHGEIIYQSHHAERYQDALRQLRDKHLIYACRCSRAYLHTTAHSGPYGLIYPGFCRDKHLDENNAALRIRTTGEAICFKDRLQGRICQFLEQEIGDFIVRRRDGIVAYHLATVIDDADSGVNTVLRGADLLDSTCRQIYLQHLLGLAVPDYAHIPLVFNSRGQKLSKQHLARELDERQALPLLIDAWRLLGQRPFEADPDTVEEFWSMARQNWALSLATTTKQPAYE